MSRGSVDIEVELDIVRYVQRLRSVGIALYYLTTRQQQIIISRMASYKPLRDEV